MEIDYIAEKVIMQEADKSVTENAWMVRAADIKATPGWASVLLTKTARLWKSRRTLAISGTIWEGGGTPGKGCRCCPREYTWLMRCLSYFLYGLCKTI